MKRDEEKRERECEMERKEEERRVKEEYEKVSKLHGRERLNHLVPEIMGGEDDGVDVRVLLPKIFKKIKRHGEKEIGMHKERGRGAEMAAVKREIGEDEVWLKDALMRLREEKESVGRRGMVRSKSLKLAKRKTRKKNEEQLMMLLRKGGQ